MAGPLGKQLGVVVFMPAPQEKLDRVRHSEGRSQTVWARAAKPMSQTGWARAAKPTSQDWDALAEPPCSFLSREVAGLPEGRGWTKAQMPEDGAHSNMN